MTPESYFDKPEFLILLKTLIEQYSTLIQHTCMRSELVSRYEHKEQILAASVFSLNHDINHPDLDKLIIDLDNLSCEAKTIRQKRTELDRIAVTHESLRNQYDKAKAELMVYFQELPYEASVPERFIVRNGNDIYSIRVDFEDNDLEIKGTYDVLYVTIGNFDL